MLTSIMMIELHDVHGNEVWALTRAIDLTYYQKIKQVSFSASMKQCCYTIMSFSEAKP